MYYSEHTFVKRVNITDQRKYKDTRKQKKENFQTKTQNNLLLKLLNKWKLFLL